MTGSVLLRRYVGFNSGDDEIWSGRNSSGVGREIMERRSVKHAQ